MHENAPLLAATRREHVGSKYAARIRNAGRLPAIVYGHGEEPVPVSVDAKDAISHIVKGEKVFEMSLDGKKEYVLLKDLGYDHLGTNVIHADFARVRLDERVRTRTHVKLVGEAKGLKKAGAILMHPVTELELECQVTNLPDFIELDVSDLDVGASIYAGDVKLPKSTMVLLTDPKAVLAHIVVQGEMVVSAEAGAAGTASQPEVIGAKKDEEKED